MDRSYIVDIAKHYYSSTDYDYELGQKGFTDKDRDGLPGIDGDGLETLSTDNGVYFDHDANGFAERTGWVSGDDGLLVLDRDNDGVIEGGTELFGDQTILKNGEIASNGFEALAEWDDNGDGIIDANDAIWSNLKIWQDINEDGYSSYEEDEELFTLDEIGITAITLGSVTTNTSDGNGNTITQQGTYTKSDGTMGIMGDLALDGMLSRQQLAY